MLRGLVIAAVVAAAGCVEPPSPSAAPMATAAATPTGSPVEAAAGSVGALPRDPLGSAAAASAPPVAPQTPQQRAQALARRLLIVDGHIDLPYRLQDTLNPDGSVSEDVSKRTPSGDFDWQRAHDGGLDAPFMSIYVPAKHQQIGGAKALADSLIDMVEGIAHDYPDKFALAYSPAAVERNFKAGLVSLPLGIENGAALERKLENVSHFHARGVRYITLTHSKDNAICDSSYDTRHTHRGLSAFGRKVVVEMNRVGIMVDVAHVSDDAFIQAIDLSTVPVIASHSSCRHFTPGFERNVSDAMLTKLAAKGGVIMINFGSTFIDHDVRMQRKTVTAARNAFMSKRGLARKHPRVLAFEKELVAKLSKPYSRVERVVEHIEHVIAKVGVEHVGLGSDFDGVGDSLPAGLKDPSELPNLIRVLLERGHSEADIAKIASGNVMRVWRAVEQHAAAQ